MNPQTGVGFTFRGGGCPLSAQEWRPITINKADAMAEDSRPCKHIRDDTPEHLPGPYSAHPFDAAACNLGCVSFQKSGGGKFNLLSGSGLAVCPSTGLLAMSSFKPFTIDTFSMTIDPKTKGLLLTKELTIDKPFSMLPYSPTPARLAFTEDHPIWLLVTDSMNQIVHVLGPRTGTHAGHLAPEGTIKGPRGVATRGSLVAVSFMEHRCAHTSGVDLFRRDGHASWTKVWSMKPLEAHLSRTYHGMLFPDGLRISRDGTRIALALNGTDAVLMVDAKDGTGIEYLPPDVPCVQDVEEFQDGWLVAYTPILTRVGAVEIVTTRGSEPGPVPRHATLPTEMATPLHHTKLRGASALALVPGIGLLVRSQLGSGSDGLMLYTTPDLRAMAAMSEARVTWITVVVRGVFRRARK